MQMALTTRTDESFDPIKTSESSDWLTQHVEEGQTMSSFLRSSLGGVSYGDLKTIFLQPVGSFDHQRAPSLDVIVKFTRTFFLGCYVELLPMIDFTGDMPHRQNSFTDRIQYHTDGFYKHLARIRHQRNPERKFLYLAVTMADIYPKEEWSFLYGQANIMEGLGVYAFARLDSLFPMDPQQSNHIPITIADRTLILRRSLKILRHEILHLYSLDHCIYYSCLMNGVNTRTELDQHPLHICPVCLHKFYSILRFVIYEMYNKFANLCEHNDLEDERIWYRKRLAFIKTNNS
ncbi:unnamed protein product [Adineta steineri]|uniref:Archaemetzincin-2 n=1 Tax=Adineta steineri TaxID=433720 RepID=A0A815RJ23_9BILA|nr:unnamed protein product [Adineta steineri]